MKIRKIVLVLLVLLSIGLLFGQEEVKEVKPFGLYEGMPLKDIEIVEDLGDSFYEITPPDPSTEFGQYYILLNKDLGLCKVIAIKIEETNVYGTNVKSEYNKFKEMLTSNYGEPETDYDFLLTDSIWDEPKDWLMSLEKKERILFSMWKVHQTSIGLEVNVYDYYSQECIIKLSYEFSNFKKFCDDKEEDTKNKL